MTHNDQIKLIERAYATLPDMPRGLTDEKARLYRMNLQSETEHRRGHPPCGISKQFAARLFTVLHIADALRRDAPRFTVADVLSIRLECLRAQALAELFGKDIRAAWKAAGVTLADLKQVDYAALMQHGRTA